MFRFALVLTKDTALTRWEIHAAHCPDIGRMVRGGAFAQILSAQSPEDLIQTELSAARDGRTAADFKIMACVCEQQ